MHGARSVPMSSRLYHPRHSIFSCTFYSCSQAAGIELSISFAMPMYFLLYQCPAEQRAHFTFLPPLNVTGSGPQGAGPISLRASLHKPEGPRPTDSD